MEHRWGRRFTVDLAVTIQLADQMYDGRLRNLSASGGWITTRGPMRDLTLVKVKIQGSEEPLRGVSEVEGYVVRHSDEGFGIEWTPHAPRCISSLLRTITDATPRYTQGAA